MDKKLLRIGLISALVLVFAGQWVSAANDLFIRDILDNPQRYYNLQVQVQGEVTDVQNAPNPQSRGFYIILDNSDKTIKVVANTLPAPNQKLIVTGIVQIDTAQQIPFIREINRVEAGLAVRSTTDVPAQLPPPKKGLSTTVIILIALIVLIFIILLVVLLRKPQQPTAQGVPGAVAQPGAEKATEPASPAVEERTRQVSIGEVDRQVGGLKTKQVPNILAEVGVLSGSLSGKSFPLGYETTIGRISGDIALEDASVSREHAKIVFSENKYMLENRSSTNPAILNGERLQNPKELNDGDEIVVGVVKLRFKLI